MKKIILALTCTLALGSCEKYLDGTQLPAGTIEAGDVYTNDNMASAAVTGVLINLNSCAGFNDAFGANFGSALGLYTDELRSTQSGSVADIIYKNTIRQTENAHWTDHYRVLFAVNAAIQGIHNSSGQLAYKDQWLGEAYFVRALLHFNLANMYGAAPIVLTTDYSVNNKLHRSPVTDVYKQVIADLQLAQTMLPATYSNGYGAATTSRVRPNKAAATALLARVFLYAGDWENAELQATAVISDNRFDTVALNSVFLANSKETIWAITQRQPARAFEYNFYNNGMPATITPPQGPVTFKVHVAVNPLMLDIFEPGDRRRTEWLRTSTVLASGGNPAVVWHFPAKFKSSANNVEFQIPLRLAEQYLIRAEARAMQDKNNAADDINVIRKRAGLAPVNPGTKPALLAAIAKERQTELFTEYGHRFFDLKRTGKLDEVMNIAAPAKPAVWQSYKALWPIPPNDMLSNPNLTPNPGYVQ
ncbi:RagB/SusD family nutrient uptake outer membrane protein [Chitinophaga lutea]